jgi:hypothetical protein
MKILFIAEPFMNLHQPIVDEMRRQGHDVAFFADERLPFDWKECWWGRGKYLKHIKAVAFRYYQKYWEKRIAECHELSQPYDLLFVINGYCFHSCLLKHLRKISQGIKAELYLWDNSAVYDYFHNAKYFNRVITYDFVDAQKYGAELLPFYWIPSTEPTPVSSKYLLSIVGSNHDGRLDICRKIYDELRPQIWGGNALYFKVLDWNKPSDDIIVNKPLPVETTLQVMRESQCILDTDRESQTGTTPRLIWAIALNKKIVTTNTNITKFEFYNPEQIYIIDRNDPHVPLDFISTPLPENFRNPAIEQLRIDRWVKNILS